MLDTTQVGDQGQRYEVHAKWKHDKKDFIVGWTNNHSGGGIYQMALKHPAWCNPYIVDRVTKLTLQGDTNVSGTDTSR